MDLDSLVATGHKAHCPPEVRRVVAIVRCAWRFMEGSELKVFIELNGGNSGKRKGKVRNS